MDYRNAPSSYSVECDVDATILKAPGSPQSPDTRKSHPSSIPEDHHLPVDSLDERMRRQAGVEGRGASRLHLQGSDRSLFSSRKWRGHRMNANAPRPRSQLQKGHDIEQGGTSESIISGLMAPYEPKTFVPKSAATLDNIEALDDDSSVMTVESPYGQGALILGMERTFFAAVNNAWLLIVAGAGLMTVGNQDGRALKGGVFFFVAGVLLAMLACLMHNWRLAQIKLNLAFPLSHTALWASLVSCLTAAALILELYFAITWPYLERAATVTIETTAPSGA